MNTKEHHRVREREEAKGIGGYGVKGRRVQAPTEGSYRYRWVDGGEGGCWKTLLKNGKCNKTNGLLTNKAVASTNYRN